MAPTTLIGQNSTTTPGGRDSSRDGASLDLSQVIAITGGSAYIERTALYSPKSIRQTKKAVTKAFKIQMEGLGFSLVEVLSPCPTNWKMSPLESWQWIDKVMVKEFPLGVIKQITDTRDAG